MMIIIIVKKCIWALPKEHSKYNHKRSFAHEIHRHRISLSDYGREIKKKQEIDSILKWKKIKNMLKI